jgi:hypothetical protein
MKIKRHPLRWAGLLILGGFLFPGAIVWGAEPSTVQAFPAPAGEPLSADFVVKAEDENVPVYLATVLATTAQQRETAQWQYSLLGRTSFASFNLRGAAHLVVTSSKPITSIKFLPSSSGIVPRVMGNNVAFTLSKPGQFVLEINGDTVHCLQIFANPWDSDVPNANDPNVIYYGPGLHQVTSVKVPSGKTVYIAAGAVIYGMPGSPDGPIFKLKGDNITLRGRGVIDASRCAWHTRCMYTTDGQHLTIEGLVFRDPSTWAMPIANSSDVTIRNIKVLGYRGNSDGIDISGSRNVDIRDSYLRTGDDLIVVKTQIPANGESSHITVEHCLLWNELAHSLSIGAEIRKNIQDVHFSDCDIIQDEGREWLLRVFHCDGAHVSNVTFQNIRIEECRRLISLWIGKEVYTEDPEPGHIDNVTFENIVSPAPSRPGAPVDLVGFDAGHAIHGVQLDDIVVGGRPLTSSEVKQNAFVSGVTLKP